MHDVFSSPGPRKWVSKYAVAAAFILVTLSVLSSPVALAASNSVTTTPIKHLVVITMENHSFDNFFGKYPIDPGAQNQSIVSDITRPVNLLSGTALSGLSPVANGSFSTGNPQEGYSAYHLDWNNGKMNGFLNASGPYSMKYYTASQMAIEWDLAEQFSLGDMYFSSVLSETVPNRLYEIAGYSPVINDYGPPPYIPLNQTVFSQLSSNGISWGYYINNTKDGIQPLSLIHDIGTYSSHIGTWSSFFSSLSNNTLPSVSWLMPIQGDAEQYSQHPSYNVLIGELWLLYTVDRIMHSPEWNTTAIFINYDEGGGYYDQVSPPVTDGHQLGIRVPFIVISPYAKENYISSTMLSHTSIIAFIDYNWGLRALNSLVQSSNLPLDMFNFNEPYLSGNLIRTPLSFSDSLSSLIPGSYNFGPPNYKNVIDTSSLFPMIFQIPMNRIPYNLSGSSNDTLGSLGTSVEVHNNFAYVPFYQSNMLLAIVLISGTASFYYSTVHLLRKKR